jgi:hypothetical protein
MEFATIGGGLGIISNGEQRRRQTRERRPPCGRYEVARSVRNKEQQHVIRRQEMLTKKTKKR